MLSLLQAALDVLIGRMNPADGFHNKLYFRIVFNRCKIRRNQFIRNALNMLVAGKNILDFNLLSPLLLDLCPIQFQHFLHTGSDRSESHDCNLHPIPFLLVSTHFSIRTAQLHPFQICRNKTVYIAVQHRIRIPAFFSGTKVFHHPIGL